MTRKQGMQVFDANGNRIVDITDRLQKILGVVSISTQSGSIKNELLKNGDPWYFFLDADNSGFGMSDNPVSVPSVTINGDTLSWDFKQGVVNCKLMYGVY